MCSKDNKFKFAIYGTCLIFCVLLRMFPLKAVYFVDIVMSLPGILLSLGIVLTINLSLM